MSINMKLLFIKAETHPGKEPRVKSMKKIFFFTPSLHKQFIVTVIASSPLVTAAYISSVLTFMYKFKFYKNCYFALNHWGCPSAY